DPTDPNFLYGARELLQIHRSSDGGRSADFIYAGISDALNPARANFFAPFVLDPNDPNTILAGGSILWGSSNVKADVPAWGMIKPEFNGPFNHLSAIAVARGDSNTIWVGDDFGRVFRTRNG